MKEYVLVVYSNPVPGKEQEYNDWYNNQHLSDVLAQPDYIQARRYKLTDLKLDDAMPDASHQYVAFYHLHTDDPDAALKGMVARVEAGVIGLSDTMAPDFLAYCYAAASPLMESK
ncbi:MAG: hypothetical protein WCY88_17850 [Spongiibacteraceae bacterium]